jgi:lipopolysaccharide/colanic/teichoic acid biosynthesis glycosyltransferase
MFWARTRVKPGLAGPWQAYGRSSIPFADMIRLDYSYAVGWSLSEDLKLLFRTAIAVFNRRGAL